MSFYGCPEIKNVIEKVIDHIYQLQLSFFSESINVRTLEI